MIPKVRNYVEGDYEKYILPLDKENMKRYVDRHIKGGWSDEENKKGFQRYLENGWVFLFEIRNEVVGTLIITPDKKDETSLFINGINIKKEFQGKGYGSNILTFVEEKAKEFGFKKVRLCVFEDNPAYKLYERFGYKQFEFLSESSTRYMEKVLE
jgi:ribosomal protein S18 acetylase RimI-like enzyme